jgi:hypothetical protein
MSKDRESRKAGRDARTGEFITVEDARRHPATSVVEHLPLPGHGDSPKHSPKPKK